MSEKSTQIGEICVQVFQLNGLLNHWGDGFVADNGLTFSLVRVPRDTR